MPRETAVDEEKAAAARRAKIDRYGELDRQAKAWEPSRKEHEALKGEIKSWYDSADEDATATAEGDAYTVQVSARANVSVIDIERAYKALGKEKFLSICSVTIDALEGALGKQKTATLITKEQTGSRRLTAVAKASPAVEKAA